MLVAIYFIVGLVLLVVGAELLVRGAAKMAALIGISPLVIGLTVVAFGTSAPEFAVSVNSAIKGEANIAVGNVIGSNVFNVLFILGLSAIITPLVVSKQLIRVDVPLMIVASLVVVGMAWKGHFNRLDGIILFSSLVVYTGTQVIMSRRKGKAEKLAAEEALRAEGIDISSDPPANPLMAWVKNLLLFAVGLALLIFGSQLLVSSAVEIATALGVSELVIGLTIIAAGTSLPEVVTSVIAGLKGERDIAVGNVVGSNLFNILGVLGTAAIFSPGDVEIAKNVMYVDIPVMLAVSLVCLPVFISGGGIMRWEGAVLFSYYIAYTAYLVLNATNHPSQGTFNAIMLYGVIPVTVVVLLVAMTRTLLQPKPESQSP